MVQSESGYGSGRGLPPEVVGEVRIPGESKRVPVQLWVGRPLGDGDKR